MISLLKKLINNEKFLSLLLLFLIAAITFVPQINNLGLYKDDWHVTWAGTTNGPEKIFDMHKTDRPFMGLTYAITFFVLGNAPVAWQIYAFCIRFLGSVIFFFLLRTLWPDQKQATTITAIIFLIYPGFLQLPAAHTHQNWLVALAAGLLSLTLSLQAFRAKKNKRKIILTCLSVLSAIFCYLIMEWMIGFELVRILLMMYLFYKEQKKSILIKTAKIYIPYILGSSLFLFWRVFIFKSARAATDVGFLAHQYLDNPITMGLRFIIEIAKDFWETFALSWAVPFYNLTGSRPQDLLWAAILTIIGIVMVLIFIKYSNSEPVFNKDLKNIKNSNSNWANEAIWLGILITLILLIPPVLANRSVQFEYTLDRYTLAASTGVAISITGLLYTISKPTKRKIFLGILIFISIFTHHNNALYFKDFWENQKQLWWQLSWRAPGIKDYTVLLPLLPEDSRLADSYEIWGPANLIYHPDQQDFKIIGESINQETLFYILHEENYGRTFRRIPFTIDLKNSLVLSIPQKNSCLHVYDKNNLEISEFDDAMIHLIAKKSNIDLIDTEIPPSSPPENIFGKEPDFSWCYYYQKASLARQKDDWDEVCKIADEALEKDLSPLDTSEWMPFYEGFARNGRIDDANEIGGEIRKSPTFVNLYCDNLSPEHWQFENSIDEYLITNLCGN